MKEICDLRVELIEPGAPEAGDLRFRDLELMLVFLFHTTVDALCLQ